MPTVIEILKQHLIDNGFDGLANDDLECGCELSDLHPCGESFEYCKPAFKHIDPSRQYDYDWEMKEEKQEPNDG